MGSLAKKALFSSAILVLHDPIQRTRLFIYVLNTNLQHFSIFRVAKVFTQFLRALGIHLRALVHVTEFSPQGFVLCALN